jgi:hypothetical protein
MFNGVVVNQMAGSSVSGSMDNVYVNTIGADAVASIVGASAVSGKTPGTSTVDVEAVGAPPHADNTKLLETNSEMETSKKFFLDIVSVLLGWNLNCN